MPAFGSSPEISENRLRLSMTSFAFDQTTSNDERQLEVDVRKCYHQDSDVDDVGQQSTAISLLSSTNKFDECNDVSYEYEDFTQLVWIHHIFVVVYVVIAIFSVVGNFMVIWTIARHRHMRTVTNYYILNLAVADFLVALVVMPLKLIEYTAPCHWRVFSHKVLLCPLLYYVLPVFVFASVLTLAAISIERYYAIVHPLSAMLVHSKSRTRKVIVATWAVPIVLASPYLYCRSYTFTIYSRYGTVSRDTCTDRFDEISSDFVHFRRGFFLFLFVVVFLIPLMLIGGTCLRIAAALYGRPASDQRASPVVNQREENKRRVARMIILIAMSFWICWTPFYAITAITQLQSDSFLHKSQFLFTMLAIHLSGFINSCINPFIYCTLSFNFRRSFKQMIRSCFCCCIWLSSASSRRSTMNAERLRFDNECQVRDEHDHQQVSGSSSSRRHRQLQQIEMMQQQSKHSQHHQHHLNHYNQPHQRQSRQRHYMRQSVLGAYSDYGECHESHVVLETRPVTTR